jgi:hypothetical protein
MMGRSSYRVGILLLVAGTANTMEKKVAHKELDSQGLQQVISQALGNHTGNIEIKITLVDQDKKKHHGKKKAAKKETAKRKKKKSVEPPFDKQELINHIKRWMLEPLDAEVSDHRPRLLNARPYYPNNPKLAKELNHLWHQDRFKQSALTAFCKKWELGEEITVK